MIKFGTKNPLHVNSTMMACINFDILSMRPFSSVYLANPFGNPSFFFFYETENKFGSLGVNRIRFAYSFRWTIRTSRFGVKHWAFAKLLLRIHKKLSIVLLIHKVICHNRQLTLLQRDKTTPVISPVKLWQNRRIQYANWVNMFDWIVANKRPMFRRMFEPIEENSCFLDRNDSDCHQNMRFTVVPTIQATAFYSFILNFCHASWKIQSNEYKKKISFSCSS